MSALERFKAGMVLGMELGEESRRAGCSLRSFAGLVLCAVGELALMAGWPAAVAAAPLPLRRRLARAFRDELLEVLA